MILSGILMYLGMALGPARFQAFYFTLFLLTLFAALAIANLHWIWLIAAYLILGCLVWRLNKINRF